MAALLESYGLKKPAELKAAGAALRMRRYRDRKRVNVTARNAKRNNKRNASTSDERNESVTKEARVTPSHATWVAYCAAYKTRYGVEPTRNATVNGQLAKFVARVPAAEAPEIAAFFVLHNKSFYISSRHAVGALLRDAEGLRTEWLTNRTVTDTEARQADRTQTNLNVHKHLMDTFHPEKEHEPK